MKLTFSLGSLGASVGGKTYNLSFAGIRVFSAEEAHRVQSGGAGGVIRGDGSGRLTGAVYINDGRFVNALWLFVGAEREVKDEAGQEVGNGAG